MSLLTPNDIRHRRFRTSRLLREGYDADEVDDFLDEVAETIARVGHECLRLQADNRRLAQFRGRGRTALRRADRPTMRRRRRPAHHKPTTATTATKGQGR